MTQRPVALVTGGTRGIGAAICEELSADHHILVGGRDRAAAELVATQLPSAQAWVCDLTDADGVAAAAASVARLDLLVHSAGVLEMGAIGEASRDAWRRSFEVNVTAVADLTRLLLPQLREARGTVVTLNSGAGLRANADWGPYAASKFALTAFTDVLRQEEAGYVRVISVHPGRAATDMQAEVRAHEGGEYRAEDFLRPEDVASAVASAVRLPRSVSIDVVRVRHDAPRPH